MTLQEKLNRLKTKKINGLIVRSRLQHFESNENQQNSFFDHCKYNYEKKTIRPLLIDDKITNDESSTNFLCNRIDFFSEHKLLPVQLTWLHPGVWENIILTITPTLDGVCGMLLYIILNLFLAK